MGLLRAFYRAGFRPAAIVGTSVGAVNGAFLAFHDGPRAAEKLRQVWLSLAPNQIFNRNPFSILRNVLGRRNCFFDSGGLLRLLQENLQEDDFAAAQIPFYAVATNLTRGVKTVFHEGPVSRAVLASAAIPAVFCPVEINGDFYVDGGVLAGLDLETAVGLGARNILALDLSLCAQGDVALDPLSIWRRSIELTTRQQVRRDLERFARRVNIAHVCLGAMAVSSQDFRHTAALIEEGETRGEALVTSVLDKRGHLRLQRDLPRVVA